MKVKTSYIAEDGTEFLTLEECQRYEERNLVDKYREKYMAILYEVNYMKRQTFKKMERNLAKARDAYRIAKRNGIAGSKSLRFEKLTELCSSYVYAKNLLKKAREEYKEKRKDLEELGFRLGFRKPFLRAQKERQLNYESEVAK